MAVARRDAGERKMASLRGSDALCARTALHEPTVVATGGRCGVQAWTASSIDNLLRELPTKLLLDSFVKPLFAHMTLEQLTAGGGRSVSTMRWKTAGLTACLGLRVAAPAADPPKDPEAVAKRRDGAKMFRLKSVGADHV